MGKQPVSDEIGAALSTFVAGGVGPRHSTLSNLFARAGYGNAAPYSASAGPGPQQPNKENRVRETVFAAVREPSRARELIDSILGEYRVCGFFNDSDDIREKVGRKARVGALQRAFARQDWELTNDGQLRPMGIGSVKSFEGRPAIEDQLGRLRRAADDPALLLGTAKEMLESTAKYVLEVFSVEITAGMSFEALWFHARDRLGIHPKDVDVTQPGGEQIREILQSSWSIASKTNELRNVEGTGHGRLLPTGMTTEMALLVVREACSVAEMVLSSLDRRLGK